MDSRITACDLCRSRKVRCDRSFPCSNCRSAVQECSYTGAGQRPKVPRQRVPISTQYENKIDLMERRLANIESLLLNRPCTCSRSSPGAVSTLPTQDSGVSCQIGLHDVETDSTLEGPSSLKSQVQVARRYAESVDDQGLSTMPAPRPTDQVVDIPSDAARPSEISSVGRHSYRNMPLPPTAAVVNVLKNLKESPPESFVVLRCLMPVAEYVNLCRDVYFSVDEYSDTSFIIVNSGMFYLFTEFFCPADNEDLRKQYHKWGALCRSAVIQAVKGLPAWLPANAESIQALVLSASLAIEMAKPWLAWRLTGHAAQLCIAAGFSDETFLRSDDKDTRNLKSLLFFYVYAMEKGLALRLGRASFIRECDITISKNTESLSLPDPWDKLLPFWIWNASMHDRLYEKLYSRTASAASEDDLSLAADSLLEELRAKTPYEKSSNTGKRRRLEDVLAVSQKVLYYTTATLIARAKVIRSSSPTLAPECLEFARAAVHAHQECMSIIKDDLIVLNIYLHWRLLHAPFAPVLVLFCNVVCRQDAGDILILEELARGLEITVDLSPSAREFHQLCQDLHRAAVKHAETRHGGSWMSPTSNLFSQYFASTMFPEMEHDHVVPELSEEQIQSMFTCND